MNKIPQEQLRAALQTAPSAIQDAYLSERTADVVFEIKERFKLHVDVAGELGSQVGYMLLGLMNPAEFFGNLVLAGTDEGAARDIMETVNKEIFLPLREEMRAAKAAEDPDGDVALSEQRPQMPQEVTPPKKSETLPPLVIDYSPVQATLPGSTEPVPMPPPNAPLDSQPVTENVISGPINNPMERSAPPAPVQHVFQAMPGTTHPPGWHPAAAVHIYVPHGPVLQQTPVSQPEVRVVDTTPSEVPLVLPPAPVQDLSLPTPHATPTAPISPTAPLTKDYGLDPYREPI